MAIVNDLDPATEAASHREDGVCEIVMRYAKFISARPALLSLLYDINMLPEQTMTRDGAIRLAGLCEVWKKGEEGTLPGTLPGTRKPEPDVDALAQEIRRVDGSHSLGAGALAEALMPFLTGDFLKLRPSADDNAGEVN